jgi:hypothetical protein
MALKTRPAVQRGFGMVGAAVIRMVGLFVSSAGAT